MEATITADSEESLSRSRNTGLEKAAEALGKNGVRYGLVLVLAWIGSMKFTGYEAEAVQGLIANSPIVGWLYGGLGVRSAAAAIGVAELGIAVLIAARPFSATLAAIGSALAVATFLTTLSFLVSTPGAFEASLGGFPALSVVPGQLLIKDVVLLAAAVWSFGEAMGARDDVTTRSAAD